MVNKRLTTLYLILKALKELKVKDVKVSNRLTYRAREKSNKTIERLPDFNHDDLDLGIKEDYVNAKSAYLDQSGKVMQVSVASLKFRIMMQMCNDNLNAHNRAPGKEWTFEDIKNHQDKIVNFLRAKITP